MNNLLKWAKSKTVWGSLLLGVSFIPALAPFAVLLHTIGTALAGVGIADKLDKIKEAVVEPVKKPTP